MASLGKKRPGVTTAEQKEGPKRSSSKKSSEDARRDSHDDSTHASSRAPRISIEQAMDPRILPGRPVGKPRVSTASREGRNPNLLKLPIPDLIGEQEDSTSSISSGVPFEKVVKRRLSKDRQGAKRPSLDAAAAESAQNNEDDSSVFAATPKSRDSRPSSTQMRRPSASDNVPVRRPSIKDMRDPPMEASPLQTTFIKVVARVRPKIERERNDTEGVTVLSDNQTIQLSDWRSNQRLYGVDEAVDSREDTGNTQTKFFSRAVQEFVTLALKGYNICIFAYGHTGSGKTYTMLGDGARGDDHFGVLPRFIREVFTYHAQDPQHRIGHYCCEFAEVYNEQIRDLLAPMNSERKRKIFVHPKHGVKVDGMSMSVVNSVQEALDLVQFGNQVRTVATTTMNDRSSRSHAIFSFKFQVEQVGSPLAGDAAAKNTIYESTVTFVDLAGHEDQETSTNRDDTFREMTYINKSLLYLATVINKLADGKYVRGSLADFRNSKLTLLLSQALIGNCRTLLVATLAPLQAYYDDSVSTLNFASAVKKVQTKPVLHNKNQRAMVKELEEEVRQLRNELVQAKGSGADKEKELEAATMWADHYKRSWEDAVRSSQELKRSRERFSSRIGLQGLDGDLVPRTGTGEVMPFFTKLSDDPALQGCCNYFLRLGLSRVGHDEDCNIILQGVGIHPRMCEVHYGGTEGNVSVKVCETAGVIGITDGIPRVLVNGKSLEEGVSVRMSHGDSLILGYAHALRLVLPTDANESLEPPSLARSSIKNLTLATALAEIVDGKGNQFQQVLPYLQQLGTRAPESVVQAFLQSLHKVCPLVDEANVITKDIWSRSGVFFRLQVLMDLFDLGNYKPEIVICVLQNMSPIARFKYAVHTVMHQKKQERVAQRRRKNSPSQELAMAPAPSLQAWMNVQAFNHPVFSRQNTPESECPAIQEKSSSSSGSGFGSPQTPPFPEVGLDARGSSGEFAAGGPARPRMRSRRDTVLMVGEARHPMVHALGLEDHMSVGKGSKKEPLLYVWSLEKFLRRLEEMRELYQDASEDEDNFTALRVRMAAKPHLNPWREMSFEKVKMLAESKEDEMALVSRSRLSTAKSDKPRGMSSARVEAKVLLEEKCVGSSEDLPAAHAPPKPTTRQLLFDDGAEAAAGPSPPPPKAPKPSSREASPNGNDASPDTAQMLKALAAAASVPPPAGPAAAAAASVAAAVTRGVPAEQPMVSTSEWQSVTTLQAAQASPASAVSEASHEYHSFVECTWNPETSKAWAPEPSKAWVSQSVPVAPDGVNASPGWSLAEAIRAYVAADAPAPTNQLSAPTSQVCGSAAVSLGASVTPSLQGASVVSPSMGASVASMSPSMGASVVTTAGSVMREMLSPSTQLVQKPMAVAGPLSSTQEEPDLTHLDLEELRSELSQCRLETGRMFTEQGRLASLLARFETLLTHMSASGYGATEGHGPPVVQTRALPSSGLSGFSSGDSYALRSPRGAVAVVHPSSPRMVSVGTRSPRQVSPPRVVALHSAWPPPRQAGQEYIVAHHRYTLVPTLPGTSSPSSPARQSRVVRTTSPLHSPPMLARTAAAFFPATSAVPAASGGNSPLPGAVISSRRTSSPVPGAGRPIGVAPVLPVPTTVVPAHTYAVSSLALPVSSPVPEMVSSPPMLHSPGQSPNPSYQGTPRAPLRVMHVVSRSVSPVEGRTSPCVDLGGRLSLPSPRQSERICPSPSASSFLQVATNPERTDSPRLKGGRGSPRRDSVGESTSDAPRSAAVDQALRLVTAGVAAGGVTGTEMPMANGVPKPGAKSANSGRVRGHERQGDRAAPPHARQRGPERSRSEQSFTERPPADRVVSDRSSLQSDRSPAERGPPQRPLTERASRRGRGGT